MSGEKEKIKNEQLQGDLEDMQAICKTKLYFLDVLIASLDFGLNKELEDGETSKDGDDEMDLMTFDISFIHAWKEETIGVYELQRNALLGKDRSDIYRLKLSLKHIKPPMWRTVEVPSFIKMDELHDIIQELFEWSDSHLHIFEAIDIHGERRFIRPPHQEPEYPDDEEHLDERYEFLFDYLTNRTRHLTYVYDFGDNWEVGIELKEISPIDPDKEYPVLLKGKRAAPPEDCGGPPGYHDLLKIIKDGNHPEYEETIEWLGGEFDPEEFNIEDYFIADDLVWVKDQE